MISRPLLVALLCLPALAQADRPAQAHFTPPKLLHFEHAIAPPELAARKQVEVVLTLEVDETGRVREAKVAQSGGAPFDAAALAAAKKFAFSPGLADGKPVPVEVTYRYRFVEKAPPPPPSPPPVPTTRSTTPAPPGPTVPFLGEVLARGERTPLAGVTVLIDRGAHVAVTDLTGRFSFPLLTPGIHALSLRSPKIAPADLKLTLAANKRTTTTYYVTVKERYSSTVRGQRVVQQTVEQTLSGDELRHIPGTQGDTIKAVQNLPGVARAPFGGGLLVVWGSAPQDTRSYVDGVYIPTLFHFFGLRSTVNSEMVSSLTFTPGGYGAAYGRGMGGVVEVESRTPREDGYHGYFQLDPLDVSGMVEGKLSKKVSFAVAVRRSLFDLWLPYIGASDFQLSPTYYDYQVALHWHASPRDDLEVFFFGSDDVLDAILKRPDPRLAGELDSHIFYHRGLATYTHRMGATTLSLTPSIGYDQPFQIKSTLGTIDTEIDATTVNYALRGAAHVPLASFLRLDAGLDFEGTRWSISAENTPATGQPREGDTGGFNGTAGVASDAAKLDLVNTAPYVGLNFALLGKRLILDPQLRVDLYAASGYSGTPDAFSRVHAEVEPRLSARWQIRPWVALKGAIGVYHQPPDPSAFLKQFGNPDVAPQLSLHYVLGADFDPTPTLHIEVEGFYKDLRQLIVRGENPGDPVLENDGVGRVYGAQLLVRQELWKNFFGWLSYTVSRSERRDHPDEPWRIFQFDQTHILTLVASYALPRGYRIGLRFRYVTGDPYTPVIGSYYDANSGTYRPIHGPLYSARLSNFHQLDVRFDKSWTFNRWRLAVYLDIQNVYDYQAEERITYNFDYTKSAPVTGLPIVPALGIRGEF